MASNHTAARLIVVASLLFLPAAKSQLWLTTLEQAGSRSGADGGLTFDGQEVTVIGQVSAKTLWSGDTYLIPIQDETGYGLLLEGGLSQFDVFSPGDWVQARGTIGRRGGMALLFARALQKLRSGMPPTPKRVSIAELNSPRFLGVLVTFEGVLASRTGSGPSEVITVASGGPTVEVVLTRSRVESRPQVGGVATDDKVRVTGIATQNCTSMPCSGSYQVLVWDPAQIVFLERAPRLRPWMLAAVLLLLAPLPFVWRMRVRRRSARQTATRLIYHTAEEVLGASNPSDIVARINALLLKIAEGVQCIIYLHQRENRTLEMVSPTPGLNAVSLRPDASAGGIAAGVAQCFRSRSVLAVHDVRRSTFFSGLETQPLPRSVLFAPMLTQNEPLGVLEFHHQTSPHRFTEDEQAALEHLANQAAIALKMLEQKAVRERVFRTEKLAAAGQLISGIAGELRSPLGSIIELAGSMKARKNGTRDPETELIEAEALRAAEIVSRLAAFGQSEPLEAQPVDIHALLSRILRIRTLDQTTPGLEIHPRFINQRILVLGTHAQLEQVFLSLLSYAEHAAGHSPEAALSMSTSLLARRIVVEIGFRSEPNEARTADPFESVGTNGSRVGLSLCRGVVQSHGGEVRFLRVSATENRFEVDLPVMEMARQRAPLSAGDAGKSSRQLTVLVVEPDPLTQKQVLDVLSARGDRVVPVSNAEEAADLAQRLRFDLTLCSVRLVGLNWVEFYERVRRQVGTFVLLTPAYDPELEKAFQNTEGYVLNKPIDATQLNRICDTIAKREPSHEAMA